LCLSVPGKVVRSLANGTCEVETVGGSLATVTPLIDSVRAGEYVSVYAGAIVEKLSREDYDEAMGLWEELMRSEATELGKTSSRMITARRRTPGERAQRNNKKERSA
jgi:hydrogenase maturation factor